MKKIRLDFKYCERGRFYRTLAVKEDINLVDLGCAIVTAFNGAYEHCFYFKTKEYTYNPKAFMEDSIWGKDLLMDDYTLEALGDRFEFCYDTGEGWDFTAKVYKRPVEPENSKDDVYLIDGAGLGIFEDNISTLYNYLEGRLDPESSEEDELNRLPWNLSMHKYGDFDEAFNLEDEKLKFSIGYILDKKMYRDAENGNTTQDEEEMDDEETEDIIDRIQENLLVAVHGQIDNVDYVSEAYQRLLSSYSEEEAVDKIAEVLLKEIINMQKESREFDEKHYKKELSKLK